MKIPKIILSTLTIFYDLIYIQTRNYYDFYNFLHFIQESNNLSFMILLIAGVVGLCTLESPVGTIIDSVLFIFAGIYISFISKNIAFMPFSIFAFSTGIAFLVMGIISLVRKSKKKKNTQE